ncbi:ABC transporter permease [Streptomyces sp. NA04227]|uniref:ABC transporter permease n=1 Tax=Streptomyces sp. NA04227 TaxID=2742136 RepID=UPI00159014B6|nr:ABC transporter permease [Streptomyces sp. NA04227]QKW07454.1 ABC transporter permease [Streptomyces sp. NA04227]
MTAVAVPAKVERGGGSRPFAGTGTLFRLAMRRDRIMLPVWVLVVGGVVGGGAGGIEKVYDTAAKRATLAEDMTGNSSLRALYGPVFDDSIGGLVAWRYGAFATVIAAVMSLILVVRHTREEEETGRQEMLSSTMVGRRAPLTAALTVAFIANAGITLLVAGGLSSQDKNGALAFGLAIGAVGMLFAGIAAIIAQLTETARLAKGLTAAVLGVMFLLRAAGDSATDDASSPLNWISPLGWAENMRPFAEERWGLLGLFTVAILLTVSAAYALAARRDLGMSFLPTRPGPAQGTLATAGGLAWRLQRGSLLGWSLGFLLGGIVFGGMTDGAADLVGDNESTRDLFERMGGQSGITEAFLSSMVGLFGMVAALFAVASVLRLYGEETSQRAEPLLSNAVSRVSWAAGHLVIAFGGAALIMMVSGVGLSLGYGKEFPEIMGACLVQVPAIWTLAGITLVLYALVPKLATAGWAVAGACLALGWIGPAADLPQSVMNISPYGHLPKLPGPEMEWTPVLVLLLLSVALVAIGLSGLRRRDQIS